MISVTSCTRPSASAPGRAGQELEIVDDDAAEPSLALQPARAGGELGDGDAAGLVDIEREGLQLLRHFDEAVELGGIDASAAYLLRGISACSEMMRVASCSADISSEKKPTTAPSSTSLGSAVGPVVLGHVKAILVASAVLPIEGVRRR